jgi:hypothetical protein
MISKMRAPFCFALSVLVVALSSPMPASADIVTVLTLDSLPPADSPFAGQTMTGSVQLFTGTTGNLVQLGSTTQLPSISANHEVVLTWVTPETAACWIAISGFIGNNQMFAFSSDPNTWLLPAVQEPPQVDVGMLNGALFEEATGALVAFDAPEQVGTWTLTETVTPIPATLPLFATGIGSLGLLGWRRKRKTQAAA